MLSQRSKHSCAFILLNTSKEKHILKRGEHRSLARTLYREYLITIGGYSAPLKQHRDNPATLLSSQANGVVLFEGVLKLYWGLKKAVTLPPGSTYAKQRYNRCNFFYPL